MGILLGNLNVSQIEKRLSITLTDEEREFLINTRQDKAENIAKDKWHCFDIPFTLVCGSEELAIKVREILEPYAEKMTGSIAISWS